LHILFFRKPGILLLSALSLFLFAHPVFAGEREGQKPYYGESKDGWWWYETEPEKEQKEQEEKPPEGQSPPKTLPSLSDYTIEELWNMHPDDFQALLTEFMKKAVMSPTVETVREYYVMQDIARRKSLAFANVAATVMQTHPELTTASAYPITTPGQNARVRLQSSEIEAKIRTSKDEFAILYFFSPTCEYCKAQRNILAFFTDKYGWQVKPINIEQDPNLAARFNVNTVPYLLLIYKYKRDYIPISAGVIALSEMEKKLYRGIRLLSGEITPEEFSLYEFQRGGPNDPEALLRKHER
jgi:conjugal transfer pilus assembly protein TraF